jgi:hypothetical protein
MDMAELGISKKSRFFFAEYYYLNQLGNKSGEWDGGAMAHWQAASVPNYSKTTLHWSSSSSTIMDRGSRIQSDANTIFKVHTVDGSCRYQFSSVVDLDPVDP